MKKFFLGSLAIVLSTNFCLAQTQSPTVKESDQIRFSWREVSSSKDQDYSIRLDLKICAATPSNKKADCVLLGSFSPIAGKLVAGTATDIKKNTEWLLGSDLLQKIALVTKGKKDAIVRLTGTLYQVKGNFPEQADEQYLAFPALDALPETGKDKIQLKMIFKAGELRTRLLVEIKR